MKKPPARSKRAGVFELFAQKFKVLFIHRTLYQVPQGFFWVAVKVKAFHTSVKLPRCAVKIGIPVGIQLFSGTGCEIQVFQQIIKFLLKCFGIHGEKQFQICLIHGLPASKADMPLPTNTPAFFQAPCSKTLFCFQSGIQGPAYCSPARKQTAMSCAHSA